MGFGEFESKRKMLGYSFFYILLQYIALTSDMHTAKITLPSNLGSMSSRLSVRTNLWDVLCHFVLSLCFPSLCVK